MIVSGNVEFIAQRDDVLIHFNSGNHRGGQVAVTELGERSASQAEQQDALRSAIEQEEGHHLAGVSERQSLWIAQLHRTLNRAEVEVKEPPHSVVNYEGLVVGT